MLHGLVSQLRDLTSAFSKVLILRCLLVSTTTMNSNRARYTQRAGAAFIVVSGPCSGFDRCLMLGPVLIQ